MRKGTLCFLKRNSQVLLAYIEYSPTDRKWAGIGGMVEENEALNNALVREINEETFIKVHSSDVKKVAELNWQFQLNVFLCEKWTGEIKVKEPSLKELKWFEINKIPYSEMHPGTDKWLPQILEGKYIKIVNNEIMEVEKFT